MIGEMSLCSVFARTDGGFAESPFEDEMVIRSKDFSRLLKPLEYLIALAA